MNEIICWCRLTFSSTVSPQRWERSYSGCYAVVELSLARCGGGLPGSAPPLSTSVRRWSGSSGAPLWSCPGPCRGQRVHCPTPPGVLKDGSPDAAPLTRCVVTQTISVFSASVRVKVTAVNRHKTGNTGPGFSQYMLHRSKKMVTTLLPYLNIIFFFCCFDNVYFPVVGLMKDYII